MKIKDIYKKMGVLNPKEQKNFEEAATNLLKNNKEVSEIVNSDEHQKKKIYKIINLLSRSRKSKPSRSDTHKALSSSFLNKKLSKLKVVLVSLLILGYTSSHANIVAPSYQINNPNYNITMSERFILPITEEKWTEYKEYEKIAKKLLTDDQARQSFLQNQSNFFFTYNINETILNQNSKEYKIVETLADPVVVNLLNDGKVDDYINHLSNLDLIDVHDSGLAFAVSAVIAVAAYNVVSAVNYAVAVNVGVGVNAFLWFNAKYLVVTQTNAETASEANTETATEASSEANTETATEASSEANTETATEASSEANTETATEANAETDTEVDANTDAEGMADFNTDIIVDFSGLGLEDLKSKFMDRVIRRYEDLYSGDYKLEQELLRLQYQLDSGFALLLKADPFSRRLMAQEFFDKIIAASKKIEEHTRYNGIQ